MKRFQYLLFFLSLGVVSCSEPEVTVDPVTEDEANIESMITTFDDGKFPDPMHLKLLEELDICEMVRSDSSFVAECSPENFKLIEFKNGANIEDAFILQQKSGIVLKGGQLPLPVRHLIVFERIDGQLVRVNGFRGDLIEMSSGEKGKNMLLALYVKEDDVLFHCKFIWDGERYSFDRVVAMDLDRNENLRVIKEEVRDSVSKEIYTSLVANHLIF